MLIPAPNLTTERIHLATNSSINNNAHSINDRGKVDSESKMDTESDHELKSFNEDELYTDSPTSSSPTPGSSARNKRARPTGSAVKSREMIQLEREVREKVRRSPHADDDEHSKKEPRLESSSVGGAPTSAAIGSEKAQTKPRSRNSSPRQDAPVVSIQTGSSNGLTSGGVQVTLYPVAVAATAAVIAAAAAEKAAPSSSAARESGRGGRGGHAAGRPPATSSRSSNDPFNARLPAKPAQSRPPAPRAVPAPPAPPPVPHAPIGAPPAGPHLKDQAPQHENSNGPLQYQYSTTSAPQPIRPQTAPGNGQAARSGGRNRMRLIEARIKEARREQRGRATIGNVFANSMDRYRAYHAMRLMLELRRGAYEGRMDASSLLDGFVSAPNLEEGSAHNPPAGAMGLVLPLARDIAACLDLVENYSDLLFGHLLDMRRKQFLLQAVAKGRTMTNVQAAPVGPGSVRNSSPESSKNASSASGSMQMASSASPRTPSRHQPAPDVEITIPADAPQSALLAARNYQRMHMPLAAAMQAQNLVRIADSHLFSTLIDGYVGRDKGTASIFAHESTTHTSMESQIELQMPADEAVPMSVDVAHEPLSETIHHAAFGRAPLFDNLSDTPSFRATASALDRQRDRVISLIRDRKLRTREAWATLGDRYLESSHKWNRHMDDIEQEEAQAERSGPQLRGSLGAMRSGSSIGSSLGGYGEARPPMGNYSLAGLGAAAGFISAAAAANAAAAAQAVAAANATALVAAAAVAKIKAETEAKAVAEGRLYIPDPEIRILPPEMAAEANVGASPGALAIAGVAKPSISGISIGDVAKSDYEQTLMLAALSYSENLQKRVSTGAAPPVDMMSPWVGPDYTRGPPLPVWPTALRDFVTKKEKDAGDEEVAEGSSGTATVPGQSPKIKAEPISLPKNGSKSPTPAPGPIPCTAQYSKVVFSVAGVLVAPPSLSSSSNGSVNGAKSYIPAFEPTPPFPAYSRTLEDVVDLGGSRLTTDGRRQMCGAVPASKPCPKLCNCARQVDNSSRYENPWSDMEKAIFIDKFLQFPKNFCKIASYLRNHTTRSCIKFYYDSKAIINYKALLREADSRRRGPSGNHHRAAPHVPWSQAISAASSVSAFVFPSTIMDSADPLTELPVDDVAFHSFFCHPPFAALALGVNDLDGMTTGRFDKLRAIPRAVTLHRALKSEYRADCDEEAMCKRRKVEYTPQPLPSNNILMREILSLTAQHIAPPFIARRCPNPFISNYAAQAARSLPGGTSRIQGGVYPAGTTGIRSERLARNSTRGRMQRSRGKGRGRGRTPMTKEGRDRKKQPKTQGSGKSKSERSDDDEEEGEEEDKEEEGEDKVAPEGT